MINNTWTKYFALIFLGYAILSGDSNAAGHETLPTYHWAYQYIDQLYLRINNHSTVKVPPLFILNKPYTRDDVARWLGHVRKAVITGQISFEPKSEFLLNRLYQEFGVEMAVLKTDDPGDKLGLSCSLSPQAELASDQPFDVNGQYRVSASLAVGNWLTMATTINNNRSLRDDSLYWGKKKWGQTAYSEQGYARLHWRQFEMRFGRDFIKWGPGETGQLLLSDYGRPLDFFGFSAQLKKIKLTYFFANLKHRPLDNFLKPQYDGLYANRYIAAHRLDSHWLNGRLHIGLTEAVLFGGPARNVEFAYANPFITYFGAVENDQQSYINGGNGNLFADFDIKLYLCQNIAFWAEILVDDLQVDRGNAGDLEPPEWGLLFGGQLADLFGWLGSDFWLEYVRITNRTYNAYVSWERWVNCNQPIGHYLGNDFDRWEARLSYWLNPCLRFHLGVVRLRRGEGRVEKPFDTPWMDRTLDEGYREPFPTGIVEKNIEVPCSLVFQPNAQFWLSLGMKYIRIQNVENKFGERQQDWRFTIDAWFEWKTR